MSNRYRGIARPTVGVNSPTSTPTEPMREPRATRAAPEPDDDAVYELDTPWKMVAEIRSHLNYFLADVNRDGTPEGQTRIGADYASTVIAIIKGYIRRELRAAAWQEFEAAMLEAAGERTIEMKVTIPALPKNIVSNRSAELKPFVIELLAAIAPKETNNDTP